MIRPQDILVLLKLAAIGSAPTSQNELASGLKLSPAEVSNSLRRAARAHLFVPGDRLEKRRGRLGLVRSSGLCEFAVHGIRYAFATGLGETTVGMPTAWGAPPLCDVIVSSADGVPVWPSAHGDRRGMAVTPLYDTVPHAAAQDPKLYELLVLVDAIRVGRARERAIAGDALRQRLKGAR
jgi:hypothetical protein